MAGKRGRSGSGFPAFGGRDPLLDASPRATLDLHGDTAADAERRVRDFVLAHARVSRGQVVHVITGKGRGSGGRPVLPGVVRRVLATEAVARFVAEWTRDLDDAGFLIKLT
jgi:DNA-nicking Smr family endonuclease